eukprot:CAMPEP_0170521908 /NCGR_PEP_ID=MMETSP0209-20121228/7322_1 /TAXON_ID=665100 ORGANISM="Litonotus pictus, Strain P1" /NCGR_SAMPLE_ID=MMETSP0209 /ASSEMBLY_ACC=CAM_ASM_000301 /LENGTH=419 /DNA_ID=CAMNT_0010809085 /DNA_START=204 /DNA_END=1463 /DNA_ORIENTATION=-
MNYYSVKRFKTGDGVTQPSQKRYIYFFHQLLNKTLYYPLRITLEGLLVNSVPNIDKQESIKPFFNLFLENSDTLEYTSKKPNGDQRKIFASKDKVIKLTEDNFKYNIVGDFTISVYENNKFSDKMIGRISYNTAFMKPEGGYLNFNLENTDPDNLVKKKDYPKDFMISLKYSSCCPMINKDKLSINLDEPSKTMNPEKNKKLSIDENDIEIVNQLSNKRSNSSIYLQNKVSNTLIKQVSKDDSNNKEENKNIEINKDIEERAMSLSKEKSVYDNRTNSFDRKSTKPVIESSHDEDKVKESSTTEKGIKKFRLQRVYSREKIETPPKEVLQNLYKNDNKNVPMCTECEEFLNKHGKIKEWDEIRDIVSYYYLQNDPRKIIFGDCEPDIEETLKEMKYEEGKINFEEEHKNVSMQGKCQIF